MKTRAPQQYGTIFVTAMLFALWCKSLPKDPTAKQIQERFGVSRATSFRWRTYWIECKDVPL